ncbi:TIGR03067 domain-containing protein [Taklimakanibacter lacteus]|uniref:TIGR03067 domain-containing protein n=1 Tax=Taklimakanibacter lacteus TaxID=2268456 RepID=UPI000E670CA6
MRLFQYGALMLPAFVLLGMPARAADVEQPLATSLEGDWTAVTAERNGAAAGELVGNRLAFDEDRFRISRDNQAIYGGGFTLNSEVSPAQIDFAIGEGAARGQSWLGIVRLEHEVLTICDNAPDPKAPRPTGFATSAGSGHVCLTFKR